MRPLLLLALSLSLFLAAPLAAAPRPSPEVKPAPQLPPLLRDDARIEKPVSLRFRKAPLSRIATEIGRLTGVEVRAHSSVADEPAVVVVRDRPAREVMHHLALLFHYTWSRESRGGTFRYELYQDQKAKSEEAALRDGPAARAFEDLQSKIRLVLDLSQRPPDALEREYLQMEAAHRRYFENWDDLSPAERRSRMGTPELERMERYGRTMWTYRDFQKPLRRSLAQVVRLLTPQQWQAMLAGEPVHFSTTREPGAVELPPDLARSLRTAQPSLDVLRNGAREPEALRKIVDEEQKLRDRWSRASGVRLSFRVERHDFPYGPSIALSLTPTAVTPGEAEPFVIEANGIYFTGESDEDDLRRALPLETEQPEQVPEAWKQDPVLGRVEALKVVPPTDPWSEPERLSGQRLVKTYDLAFQIADAYGIDLIADAYQYQGYPQFRKVAPPSGERRPLYSVLNRHVLPNSHWSRVGEVFHVRRAGWYRVRLAEVPERVQARWEEQLRKTPQLSLVDASRLVSSLSDLQLETLRWSLARRGLWLGVIYEDHVADIDGGGRGKKELLRAYNALLPAQRLALQRGGAVPFESLRLDARRWVVRAFERDRDRKPPQPGAIELAGTALGLEIRPLLRAVEERRNGYWIEYRLPQGREVQGGALPVAEETETYYDHIPRAPGLEPPVTGETYQAFFHVVGPAGLRKSVSILLPRAALRTMPAAGAPAAGSPTVSQSQ